MYQLLKFSEREQLELNLAEKCAQKLNAAVISRGKASIAVSGGSTPLGFFKALSQHALPWDKINVVLVDERLVDETHSDSNTKLVKVNLMQNYASRANFVDIKPTDIDNVEAVDRKIWQLTQLLPLDVAILGMGNDGHTASLFPCSDQIAKHMAMDAAPIIFSQPKTAPHQRVSFSFASLIQSKSLFMQLFSSQKLEVLDNAIQQQDPLVMPVSAFLQDKDKEVEIFWAP